MIRYSIATMDDVEKVAALDAETFPDPWSESSIASCVVLDYCTILTAFDADRVVGYIIYYHIINEGEIARVAVAKEYRRQGIAKRLLEIMLERGEEEGLIDYSLEVREHNEAAIGLYESFDFRVEGRRKNYYHNPTEDGLIMWRRFADLQENAKQKTNENQQSAIGA